MSTKHIRMLLDDIEGDEVEADAGTVLFGLDGKAYEIDLSKKNAQALRGFLQPYVEHARPANRRRVKPVPHREDHNGHGGGPSGYNRDQLMAIRQWARRHGWPHLSDKGRVPRAALDAFERRDDVEVSLPNFSSP